VFTTPRSGNELVIANLIVETIKRKWRDKLEDIVAIGVASIGPLDIKEGRVISPANLPLKSFDLLKPLIKALKKPVLVANDAVAAVWGEAHYGDGRGYNNVVYITLSTGVGCGAIVDGNLLVGKMGNAHEAGHIVVDFNSDLRCGCGGRGHWEVYAGGANLPKVAKYLVEKYDVRSVLADLVKHGREIDAKIIFDYYRRGDLLAERIVDLYIKATAAGLASIINTYDPEILIMGGSVFLNNIDVLFEPIISLTRENVITTMPIIKPTRLSDDVGLYGALALVVYPPQSLLKIQGSVIKSILGDLGYRFEVFCK
jgi:glucokinase